jgi:hypothetical protein
MPSAVGEVVAGEVGPEVNNKWHCLAIDLTRD